MVGFPARRSCSLAALALLSGSAHTPAPRAQQPTRPAAPAQSSGSLRRRAEWHAMIAPMDGASGPLVQAVDQGSPAGRAGLRTGDRLVSLNGRPVQNPDTFSTAFHALKGLDTVRTRVVRGRRGGDTLELRFVLDSVAHELTPGTTTTYGAVRSDRGYLLRTIVNRPERASGGRLPAVLFIPWLSCDPVEKPEAGSDGFALMLREVAARSGMVLMRVEKPGVGDSRGPDCRAAGLEDELAAPRAGLRALRSMPEVDSARIVLMGGSIGGGFAPVIAAEQPRGIAGVIAVSGFSRTWYEHMLDIERRRLTLMGRSPAQVNAAMRGFAQFYTDYLLGHRTPAEVVAARPELGPLWYDEPTHQYDRPAAYYQAVQQLDVEGAWAAVAARGIPVLIVWGEYDWIMGRAEAERAAEIVNAIRPGLAKLVILPKTDHGLMVYASQADAFGGRATRGEGGAGQAITAWLREHVEGRGGWRGEGSAQSSTRGAMRP